MAPHATTELGIGRQNRILRTASAVPSGPPVGDAALYRRPGL